ncbi:natural killer cells antigen CD94-like [Hypanus sabinus]|uniref:natural killer cells antigen CD94-like n=1 Tax=Hypanus sabinus TaxID=79690 RepID=UPI0028C3797D|nr:natural killer cells antigen CD94-like [Hypanus sabinus]
MEQTCYKDWVRNEDRCYFISTFETSYRGATKQCSNYTSRLLQLNTTEEKNFFFNAVCHQNRKYWIGKCKDGKVASNVLYKTHSGNLHCTECKSSSRRSPCNRNEHHFICETAASVYPDIPEEIQDLCRHPIRELSIM